MGNGTVVLTLLVPVALVVAFLVHWMTIAGVPTAAERLPLCRGAYLGASMQLVVYAWVLFALGAGHGAATVFVPLGMSFSFLGDFFNLQFPVLSRRVREPLFLGILSFAAAQLCYILAIFYLVPLQMLVRDGALVPILAALVVVPAILFFFGVYDRTRPKSVMFGAFFYGFILGAMAALAVSAAIAFGGAWIFVAAGAGMFLLSDAIMGQTTIRGRHPRTEFQVPWLTYLAAQGLIIGGLFLV
jgi:hypothetical protein